MKYCHTPSEKRLIRKFVRHKFPDGVIPIHALKGVMTIHPGYPCEEEALQVLWESLPNRDALPDWEIMRLLLPHTFKVPLTLQHHGAMVHLSSGDMHVHPWGITPEVELEMWRHILARIQDCQYPIT